MVPPLARPPALVDLFCDYTEWALCRGKVISAAWHAEERRCQLGRGAVNHGHQDDWRSILRAAPVGAAADRPFHLYRGQYAAAFGRLLTTVLFQL